MTTLNLSANISLLFPDLPFLERAQAAARAGFRAVEVMYPYDVTASSLAQSLRAANVTLSVLNAPPGDYGAGERGLAAIPGREQDFRRSLDVAIEYAHATQCGNIHVLTGNRPRGADPQEVWNTLRGNLMHAAEVFARHDLNLLLEPLSSTVLPDYSMTRVEAAAGWLKELRAAGFNNASLQVDLYHTQMEQGNLAAVLREYFGDISYVQIAGVPGRHEPDIGEINYRYLLKLLETFGFRGWVGCEYIPRGDTDAGLRWARDWGLLQPSADTA